MTISRSLLTLALGASMVACAPASKVVMLKADARVSGGREAVAKITAPGGWYQAAKKADRADLSSPDNFSSISMTVTAVTADDAKCPELAKRAVADAAAKTPDAKAELFSDAPDTFDYRLTLPATPPGPNDKFVQGRAMCRNGALAFVTCTTGINRRQTTGEECKRVLGSLSIDAPGASTAPAVSSGGLGVAVTAASTNPTAAPEAAPAAAGKVVMPNAPNINERRWENVLAQADKDLQVDRAQWTFEYAGDNRYVFKAGEKAVEYVLYCSYGNCVWSTDLLGRAAFDLGCKDLKVSVLGEATRGVEGCGKKTSYTFNPFNKAWEGGK